MRKNEDYNSTMLVIETLVTLASIGVSLVSLYIIGFFCVG